MTENRPAEAHDVGYFRAQRASSPPRPIGESARQVVAPKIRHYGTSRPIVTVAPKEQLRLTRAEIEAALHGSNNGNPATEEIVGKIVLEVARMDQYPEGSYEFNTHHQTVLRELRMLGLYPV